MRIPVSAKLRWDRRSKQNKLSAKLSVKMCSGTRRDSFIVNVIRSYTSQRSETDKCIQWVISFLATGKRKKIRSNVFGDSRLAEVERGRPETRQTCRQPRLGRVSQIERLQCTTTTTTAQHSITTTFRTRPFYESNPIRI